MSALLHEVYVLADTGKPPTRAFLAVLATLAEQGEGYTAQLAALAGVERAACTRLLRRMTRLGIVYRWREDGDVHDLKRALRVYYRLTVAGRELAEQITAGVAR